MEKIALVTGGTRGIGKAIALQLKNEGYCVISTYVNNKESADSFSNETGIHTLKWDVSCGETSPDIAKKMMEDFDVPSVIVHNAGITKDSFFHKMDVKKWNDVIQTNLSSCYNLIQPFINAMREQNYGRIILISSINGLKGQMGQTNYCAAKAGMIGFTKALALENAGKGITVNAIAPGYVSTDMVKAIDSQILDKIKAQIPVGRLGEPEEIARAVSFLSADQTGFITGETLNINGGQYLA